jgi:hypothetical protein
MTSSRAARPRAAPRPRPTPRREVPVGPLTGWRRWGWVAALTAFAVLGLPLAHAVLGEVAALLGASALLGFLIGRWTAR